MNKKNKQNFHYAWMIVLAVSIIRGLAAGGINNSAGLFLKPVGDEIGVGIGTLSLYLSVSSLVMIFWLPIAGKLVNRYSAKKVAILAAILQAVPFIGLGFMNSVWSWYLLAIPNAMGGALLINILGPVLINRWFHKQQGLAIGLMMASVGILGAIIQPIASNIIAMSGWRSAYVVIGLVVLVLVVITTLLFIKDAPNGTTRQAYGYDEHPQSQASQSLLQGVEAKVAKKSSSFYFLLFFVVALTGFGVFSQHITTYGLELGHSLPSVGAALSISMIGSAIGSFLIGIFSDKVGIIKTSICMLLVGLLAVILFVFSGKNYYIFTTAAFLHGVTAASIAVLSPLLTAKFFGRKDYESLFSMVMIGAPLASIILLPAYGFIYDIFGSYLLVFILLFILLIVAMIMLVIGYRNSCKLENK